MGSTVRRNPNTGDPRAGNNPEIVPYWSTGLCNCFSDVRVCFMTLFCPCVTFGRIAEIADQGSTPCWSSGSLYALLAFTLFPCLYSCRYRAKLRSFYTLHESPCGDCMVHFFCEFCSLCQEYRELKSRGFDMSIGWEGNMERKQHLAPMFEAGMSR